MCNDEREELGKEEEWKLSRSQYITASCDEV